MLIKNNNYFYKTAFALVEKEATHYPQILYTNSSNTIIIKNDSLFNGEYNLENVTIWIKVFLDYKHVLDDNIIQSYHLRKNLGQKWKTMGEYILHMYNEYLSWLTYMRKLSLDTTVEIKPLKKYYISFFSVYNKIYYLDLGKQKQIRNLNYKLNPLINYWFACQNIETQLNLIKFSRFLPKIKILYSEVIKNK